MNTKNKVFYSDFGAIGDGVADDFAAIKAAHDYANEKKLPVFADKGATYYINRTGGALIRIKTDTDWSGASFTIDDRNIVDDDIERRAGIFVVEADYSPMTVTAEDDTPAGAAIRAINATAKDNGGVIFRTHDTPVIDLGLGYPAMLTIYNRNVKQYIRYGGNANKGGDQHEIVMVDSNGQVDPATAILHDFETLTDIVVKRIDDTPITIRGGVFTTRANQCKETYAYFNRGIAVCRPNTTVTGLEHYITDEGEHGNPYTGWLRASDTCNVTFEDCIVTGHRVYYGMSSVSVTPQGTYDIGAGNSCNILWRNVIQSNFFHLNKDGTPTDIPSIYKNEEGWYCWGIMGSNYCKTLAYEGCKLTRFDAHCGTYNPSIKNTHVCMVSIIGGGKFELLDSTIYSKNDWMVLLRDDYGSTFAGDMEIKNVTFKTDFAGDNLSFARCYYYNHNFGYQCYMPQNITFDNLMVESPSTSKKTIDIFSGPGATTADIHNDVINGVENVNKVEPTKKVVIKNNLQGHEFLHPKHLSNAFEDVELVVE